MKIPAKPKHFLVSFAILILALISVSWHTDGVRNSLPDIPSPPPASMDELYPPKSNQPIYVFAMLEIDHAFSGIIVNLFEEDFENAARCFEKFKNAYSAASKLVPEWEKEFPVEPVDEFGRSMHTGDKGKIMAALEQVGAVCHKCHIENMVKAQQRYRWKDFESVTVNDPVTSESVTFARLMQFLSVDFSGISVNLEEGQPDNAKKQFEQFRSRFAAMRTGCTQCHTTERKYYTDESVLTAIDELGSVLSKSPLNQKLIEDLSMKIGNESCDKCHLVHVPAAMTKLGWKMMEKDMKSEK